MAKAIRTLCTAFIFLVGLTGLLLTSQASASSDGDEKPIQHLKLEDVASMDSAQQIFEQKTAELQAMKQLDPAELQQIHIITYSLEKSVAYLADNTSGDEQRLAHEIAVVVEDIHLDSENNRQTETKKHLDRYFSLAQQMMAYF
ncbi:DUF6746 family protein [Corallincola platygyrae]|uniref:DUF6746 family protein n=1 Tax=Corallincola platygyrae TaxID=1193278 RepID=A0ABW4XTT9_9GAMM